MYCSLVHKKEGGKGTVVWCSRKRGREYCSKCTRKREVYCSLVHKGDKEGGILFFGAQGGGMEGGILFFGAEGREEGVLLISVQ